MELIVSDVSLIRWKIINGDGHEDHPREGTRYDSYEEAKEDCDWLHEKYDIDTDDGFGNEHPWFMPVLEKPFVTTDQWQCVRYTKEIAE